MFDSNAYCFPRGICYIDERKMDAICTCNRVQEARCALRAQPNASLQRTGSLAPARWFLIVRCRAGAVAFAPQASWIAGNGKPRTFAPRGLPLEFASKHSTFGDFFVCFSRSLACSLAFLFALLFVRPFVRPSVRPRIRSLEFRMFTSESGGG